LFHGHGTFPGQMMDQVILQVLAAEVQRRKCPGCGNSLRQADVTATYSAADKVQLHFRCSFCIFEGGGEIELTPEIYQEAAESAGGAPRPGPYRDPITADEMIWLHEILAGWNSGFAELIPK
jgi:hypothetical protein